MMRSKSSATQRGNTMYMTPEEIREKFPDAVIGSGAITPNDKGS